MPCEVWKETQNPAGFEPTTCKSFTVTVVLGELVAL